MDGRVYCLINQLNEDIAKDWSIDEMARVTELSSPHFQRLFKDETGSSPKACLKELRLVKAAEILVSGFTQINQIGRQVGLVNDGHFTRDFRRRFGLTPSDFRKKYWDDKQV